MSIKKRENLMHGPRNRVDEDEERIGELEDKTKEISQVLASAAHIVKKSAKIKHWETEMENIKKEIMICGGELKGLKPIYS